MDRSELSSLIRRVGCTVTRPAADGFPAEYDCADPWAKVRMLDLLATRDARYDPRVRRIGVAIARAQRDTQPSTLARAILVNVSRRVRYVGEGIETFQTSSETWRTRLGDCDDMARLVVAIARSLGLDAEIVALANRDNVPIHASAKILGRWADPSVPGAAWGEHPVKAFRRIRGAGAPTRNYGGDMGDLGDLAESRQIARQALSEAWDTLADVLPAKTAAALQMVQAVALGPEGSDGSGCWTHRGTAEPCPGVCHNWAGLQLPGSPTTHDGSVPDCPDGSAPCTDHLQDGSEFGVCFMTYPSQAAGAAAYLKRLIVTHQTAAVVGSGSADQMAAQMYATHYFGGFGSTAEERINKYAQAIADAASQKIAPSLAEPLYVTRGGGSTAPVVAKIQGYALPVAAGGAALALAYLAFRSGVHRKLWRAATARG